MTKDLTTGSPLKLIIQFAFPQFLGMLFQQFYNVVDTIIVGKLLGVGPLAGVGATGALSFMVLGFCMGICNGFAIPIAQAFGANDQVSLRKYIANSFWLTALFSLVLTVPVCIFCRPILQLMSTPEDVFEYAYQYIFIIFLGIPTVFLYNILAGILRSLGDSRTPVIFLALSSALNIALDIVTIRLFHTGVGGPALATVISQGVSGVVCYFYMKKRFAVLRMEPQERRPDGAMMKRLCYMGVPMGLQYSVTAIGSLIIQATMNGFGSTAVAGATAANRINGFLACPIEALGASMAPYTGQNLGAGRLDRITKGVVDASVCGFVCAGVPGRAGSPGYRIRHPLPQRGVCRLLPADPGECGALLHPGHGLFHAGHPLRSDGDARPLRRRAADCPPHRLHRRGPGPPPGLAGGGLLPDSRLPPVPQEGGPGAALRKLRLP